jgi:hypothetical protein
MCVTAASLGAPVAALVQRCGIPASVASDAKGNHFVYSLDAGTAAVEAIVDADNGLVHAIELWGNAPESLSFDVSGVQRTFTLGETTLSRNDAELADDAQYSFGTTRVYGQPERMLVLTFDPATKRLGKIAFGNMATLARAGNLPGHLNDPLFSYAAPVIKHAATMPAGGTRTTIVRVDVDREGVVRHVAIVVPSTDPAFDAALPAKLGDDSYSPGMLMGRAAGGSVYREIRH